MSPAATLHCPICDQDFADEDYCPIDGVRLQPLAADVNAPNSVSEETLGAKGGFRAAAQTPTGTPQAAESAAAAPENARKHAQTNQSDAEPASADSPDAPAADAPAADPAPTAARGNDSRLADIMSRLGLRRACGRATPSGQERGSDEPDTDDSASPLPAEMAAQGWRITGTVEAHPGFDRWTAERVLDDGERIQGHYHRFRTGALTTGALYRRLEHEDIPRVPRVHGHGTVDLAGARADYELVAQSQAHEALDQWLAQGTPSEQRAMHLVPLLADFITAHDAAGLCALTFEPAQLQLGEDGALWLNSAAHLLRCTQAGSYRPELERSALLPIGWTAPEITQQGMPSNNAMVFSAGQVLALALWGQPCAQADVQHGAIAFKSIGDARLARVLMGCLWPRPAERWTAEQLVQAAAATDTADLPPVPPWESLAPGAATTAFSFAGASYWRLESLLDAAVAPARWAEALTRLDAILNWTADTVWAGQAELLRTALARGRSRDWALVALARTVRPDAPLTWRGLDLSDAEAEHSLANLAQGALHGDPAQLANLRALFRADLRGAWTPSAHPASSQQ